MKQGNVLAWLSSLYVHKTDCTAVVLIIWSWINCPVHVKFPVCANEVNPKIRGIFFASKACFWRLIAQSKSRKKFWLLRAEQIWLHWSDFIAAFSNNGKYPTPFFIFLLKHFLFNFSQKNYQKIFRSPIFESQIAHRIGYFFTFAQIFKTCLFVVAVLFFRFLLQN